MVVKLAGELGERAQGMLKGVCALSTPGELAACSLRLGERGNRIYAWWFLRSMRRRLMLRRSVLSREIDVHGGLKAKSIYEFDDLVTGPSFGFRGADHYYQTQSALNFLQHIRVPVLLIQAKNDPLIPFAVFGHAAIEQNRRIRLAAPDHGGHVAFLSRGRPRVWTDPLIRDWISEYGNI